MPPAPKRVALGVVALLAGSFPAGAADDGDVVLGHARLRACEVGLAPGLVSALQHGDEGDASDRTLVEESRAWIARYNAFAGSPEARVLADYAAAALEMFPAAYPGEVCTYLRPVLAVALSADVLRSRGGAVTGGAFLSGTKDDPLPAAIHALPERCSFHPFAVPAPPVC